MSEIRLLPGMKFMSGGVLYRPGDILPDTESTRALIKRKKAEWTEEEELLPPVSGGYWDETAKNLYALAKERGIDVPRRANKADIVELLEAWDGANHEGDA
jgi:hypothetical protein